MNTKIMTDDMFLEFYGEKPSFPIEAFAVVHDDRILGVGGVYPFNRGYVMFSDVTEELTKHRKFLAVLAHRFVLEVAERGVPIFVLKSDKFVNSDRFLRYLGFGYMGNGVYQWLN